MDSLITPLWALSSELLYNICLYSDPEDLKSFSATCHRLYSVASPLLENHRKQWAKFEIIIDDFRTARWFWHNLTVSLLTTSPGTLYIRHIIIDSPKLDRRTPNSRTLQVLDWDVKTDSAKMIPSDFSATSRNTFARKGTPSDNFRILEAEAKQVDWCHGSEKHTFVIGIRNGAKSFIGALLFPHLPNLRTLEIRQSSSDQEQYLELAVKQAAITNSLHAHCDSFGKLVKVDFSDKSTSASEFNNNPMQAGEYTLEFLATFMALPKMEKIMASRIRADKFTKDPALPPSNVVEMAFYDQDISPQAFEKLLEGGASLRTIQLGTCSGAQLFDEGKFGEVLLNTARNSLERLELLRDGIAGATKGIQLQQFTQLKSITIDYESFGLEFRKSLADVLPASLQSLTLYTVQYQEGMPKNLLQMLETKELFPDWIDVTTKGWVGKADEKALRIGFQQQKVRWRRLDCIPELLHGDDDSIKDSGFSRLLPRVVLPSRSRIAD